MILPADSHVHSEWSWDTGGPTSAAAGRMELMCQRAVRIGLPAVVFTEHFDFDDAWRTMPADLMPHQQSMLDPDEYLRPPALDVDGYLESVERCRHRYPQVTILTGVEFGQPHLFGRQAAQLVDLSVFDRVNGSLHTLAVGGDRFEPNTLFRMWPAEEVMWVYFEDPSHGRGVE